MGKPKNHWEGLDANSETGKGAAGRARGCCRHLSARWELWLHWLVHGGLKSILRTALASVCAASSLGRQMGDAAREHPAGAGGGWRGSAWVQEGGSGGTGAFSHLG